MAQKRKAVTDEEVTEYKTAKQAETEAFAHLMKERRQKNCESRNVFKIDKSYVIRLKSNVETKSFTFKMPASDSESSYSFHSSNPLRFQITP